MTPTPRHGPRLPWVRRSLFLPLLDTVPAVEWAVPRAHSRTAAVSTRRPGGPAALEGAFARRAITERAKGILRERHSIDERLAFEMLRDESHRSNHKLIEIAEAVTASVNPASQVVC